MGAESGHEIGDAGVVLRVVMRSVMRKGKYLQLRWYKEYCLSCGCKNGDEMGDDGWRWGWWWDRWWEKENAFTTVDIRTLLCTGGAEGGDDMGDAGVVMSRLMTAVMSGWWEKKTTSYDEPPVNCECGGRWWYGWCRVLMTAVMSRWWQRETTLYDEPSLNFGCGGCGEN